MSVSPYEVVVSGTSAGSSSVSVKLPRLTSTGYAKWRPDTENCFKRYGMKESDYKVEMHGYQELKRYVDSLDEQDTSEATNWVLAKLRGSIGSTSTSAGTQQVGAATSTSSTSSSKAAVDLVNVKPESKPVVSPRSISTS